MKAVILCAGSGKRTGLKYPKCLYTFRDKKSLLEKNIRLLKKKKFKNSDIFIVTGFKSNLIKNKTNNKYNYIHNKNYKTTNMVYSLNLFLRKISKKSDVLIIYSDIMFDEKCLSLVIKSKKKIVTLIDSDWLKKWKLKKNYQSDLEELLIKNNKIVKLGKKTNNLKNISGRFVGITKLSQNILKDFNNLKLLDKILSKNRKVDFTNFLMILIQKKYTVYPLLKNLKWAEFDTIDDFKRFKKLK
tara:strand:+ start:621 stop:1349 length:729 start_codon:yes stop_codon:yes gene_type:complete